jgi:carboxypeptidase family protein
VSKPLPPCRASLHFRKIIQNKVSLPFFRCLSMKALCLAFFAVLFLLPATTPGQVPVSPAPPETAPASHSASAQESSNKHHRIIPAFLILGTVFNEKDYAFPGVEVKIRRKGEKKFLYDLYTNSRGEFAVRVPDGIQYEIVVRQKKYKEQSQEVMANMAEVQKRLTFKLESLASPKAGESK